MSSVETCELGTRSHRQGRKVLRESTEIQTNTLLFLVFSTYKPGELFLPASSFHAKLLFLVYKSLQEGQ